MSYNFYLENTLKQLVREIYETLEESYQKNIEEYKSIIKAEVTKSLKIIKEKEISKDKKINYIIFTLLRTNILKKDYKYKIFLYDDYLYTRKGIEAGYIDTSFIMEQYDTFQEKLKNESKKYVGLLNNSIIQNVSMAYLDAFHKYIVEVLRKSITEITETEDYANIGKSEELEIYAGELMEPCDIIYKEKARKTKPKVIKWLSSGANGEYFFADFKDMMLDGGYDFVSLDLKYCDFRRSNMKGITLDTSALIGTNFKDCKIENGRFFCSQISEVNFENANLKNCDFRFVISFTGKHEENRNRIVGYTASIFRNANLEGANFENATIIGADFRGANIKDANFTEAALVKSKFSREQIKELNLTEEQRNTIEIC